MSLSRLPFHSLGQSTGDTLLSIRRDSLLVLIERVSWTNYRLASGTPTQAHRGVTNLPRLRDLSQALFSGKMHSLISLRHRAHGGPIGKPSGPVPKSHLALRARQGMHAL